MNSSERWEWSALFQERLYQVVLLRESPQGRTGWASRSGAGPLSWFLLLLALSYLNRGGCSGSRVEMDTYWGSALGGKTFNSSVAPPDQCLVGVSKFHFPCF